MILKTNARLLFAFFFAAIFGCFVLESESQAQSFRRPPGQEIGRFLGLGYGNGYHCRGPGPQTDYYDPYSHINSHLVSSDRNLSSLGESYYESMDQQTVPHANYTGTNSDRFSVYENLRGQTVTPAFELTPKRKSRYQEDAERREAEMQQQLELEAQQREELESNQGAQMENTSDFQPGLYSQARFFNGN